MKTATKPSEATNVIASASSQRDRRARVAAENYGIDPGLAISILAVAELLSPESAYVFPGEGPHFILNPVAGVIPADAIYLRVMHGASGGDVKIGKDEMAALRASNVNAVAWVWKYTPNGRTRSARAEGDDYRPVGIVELDDMVEMVSSWHFPSRELTPLKDIAAAYV